MTDAAIRLEGKVAIVGADEHPHAARRLREEFPSLGWYATAEDTLLAGVPVVRLRRDAARPEGAFALTVGSTDARPTIDVAGGPFSGVIYGVEELVQRRASSAGGGVEVRTGTVEQAPGLPYRAFWNWDHSTNWDTEQIGVQESGVMNLYTKPKDGFLADFKRVVDFMSRNRIAAIAIYGFFRDSHGGIAAAQELCRYANERGVRIMPGVANNAYGGVVWEMDHPFNLATWLRQHPHLAAEMERPPGFQIPGLDFTLYFPRGDYSVSGCPSRPENQQWMADGIAWLAETCEIGGVNIEAGDYGVCGCAYCQRRRAEREDANRRYGYAESWSHADLADFFPRLFEAVRSRRPDAWVYSEVQWDNLLDREAQQSMQNLPDEAVYQHTFNRPYWERVQRELTPEYAQQLPTKTNVFRCQFASQWNGDRRTERYFFNGRDWMAMAKKAAETGFRGLTVWGEMSPYVAATELSYLAFARFTWDPALTWEQFLADDVAPRLGGADAAERFLALTESLDHDRALDGEALQRMQDGALDAARGTDPEAGRRWLSLADRIARRRFNQAMAPV